MAKSPGFFYRLFNDLYEVRIVFHNGEKITYRLKEIKKINTKYLKAIDENGHKIELSSVEPFSFFTKKIY
jgi:hypothetical protein